MFLRIYKYTTEHGEVSRILSQPHLDKNPHFNRCRISLQAQISGASEPEH